MKLSAKISFTLSYLVPDITLCFVILCRTRMQYRTPFHNCTYKKYVQIILIRLNTHRHDEQEK
jgi:hypothetical protein